MFVIVSCVVRSENSKARITGKGGTDEALASPDGGAMFESEQDHDYEHDYEYACVYCKTGSEKMVAAGIEVLFPNVKTLVACKEVHFRQNGKLTVQTKPLLPGYVFCRFLNNCDYLYRVKQLNDVYHLLTDTEGKWCFRGADRTFVDHLFKVNGYISMSRAYFVGDRIRITDGPLEGYEGNIVRVNHRHKTCEVCFVMHGKEIRVWLGYELAEKTDG